MPEYMSEARVLATLLTIPRMTRPELSQRLVESLPHDARRLGRALERGDASDLDADESVAFRVIKRQA